MEDSVGEEERREQGETVAQATGRHEEEQHAAAEAAAAAGEGDGGGGEPGEEGGFLSAMASKIGAAMTGANGGGGEVNATTASDGEKKEEEDSDGGGGGGIFHKFMSSSPPASSPASGAMGTEEAKADERHQEAGGEQAGILSAMASKIGMSMSRANGVGDGGGVDDAKTNNGDTADASKGEDAEKGDEANGGGILSAMASRMGMAMSGANGNGNHGSEDDAKKSNGDAVEHSKVGEGEKGGEANDGILSTMASKIGMAMSGTNGNGNHSNEDDAQKSNGDAAGHSKGGEEEKGDETIGGILSTMASKIGMSMSGANGEGGNNGSSGDNAAKEAVHGSKSEEKDKGGEAKGGGIVEQIISNLPSDDQAPDAEEASLLIAIIDD
ncbi:hypothetical protein ACP4OV_004786 [Aristida adscensionis]